MTVAKQKGIALAAISNSESTEPRDIATRSIAGILVPDTPLIYQAIEYARQHAEPYLFNHVKPGTTHAGAVSLRQSGQPHADTTGGGVRRVLESGGDLP